MSSPIRSITIEFERMPHSRCNPVKIEFFRDGASIQAVVYRDVFAGKGKATCHPTDTFSWETGMRLSVKRALFSCHPIYRAFRRWMWLSKEQHKARRQILKGDIVTLPTMMATDMLITSAIAREFGRVKVRVE